MDLQTTLRRALSASAVTLGLISIAACDKSTPPESAQPPRHTAVDAVNNALGQTKAATTEPGHIVPGLPSVNDTSTANLSTPDAAAQRVLDKLNDDVAKGDTSEAKTLVNELQGMRASLSPEYQMKVDDAIKAANAK